MDIDRPAASDKLQCMHPDSACVDTDRHRHRHRRLHASRSPPPPTFTSTARHASLDVSSCSSTGLSRRLGAGWWTGTRHARASTETRRLCARGRRTDDDNENENENEKRRGRRRPAQPAVRPRRFATRPGHSLQGAQCGSGRGRRVRRGGVRRRVLRLELARRVIDDR